MSTYFVEAAQAMNAARARFRAAYPREDMTAIVRAIVEVPDSCFERGWRAAIRDPSSNQPHRLGLVIVSMSEELLRYGVGYGVPLAEVLRRIASALAVSFPMLDQEGSGREFQGIFVDDADATSMPHFGVSCESIMHHADFERDNWLFAQIGEQITRTRALYHLKSKVSDGPRGLPVGATIESEVDRLGAALREISEL